ncbi:MAG: TetR/AcrR family transcriptional regulator [Clostridia bacterium]|nr:MAG: TetR/AcrR family transcriptional regulator [Clostridia bacterium]
MVGKKADGIYDTGEQNKRIQGENTKVSQRDVILDVAGRLFQEKGFKATSMEDIARQVGMLKGSLYYYFPSKEDLLYEVLMSGLDETVPVAEAIRKSNLPPLEKLRKLIENHIVSLLTKHKKAPIIFLYEKGSLGEQRRDTYMRRRDQYEQVFRDIVEECKQAGCIKVRLDTKIIVFAILGLSNWTVHWYNEKGPWTPEDVGRWLSDLAVRMVT